MLSQSCVDGSGGRGWTERSEGSPGVRRWLLLTELAVAASLINPYGMDLLIHTVLFSSNPNLNDILEWYRLSMVSNQGLAVGLSCLLLTVLLRLSRARVKPAFVIILLIVLTAVCLRIRMLTWYAPIVVLTIMPHLADVLGRIARSQPSAAMTALGARLRGESFRYTLFAALSVWICFAFSPASQFVLGGKPRNADRVYGAETPRGISEYLREFPPEGQILNPQWWGDWLVWDGPPNLSVFMTTNAVHVVPGRVWKDYMAFANAQSGVERRVDRYRVQTIVVHKAWQENWRLKCDEWGTGKSSMKTIWDSSRLAAAPPRSRVRTPSRQRKTHRLKQCQRRLLNRCLEKVSGTNSAQHPSGHLAIGS